MDSFESHKLEVLRPLYLEAGLALLDCQNLEAVVAGLLRHIHRLREPSGYREAEHLGEFLADVDRKTCGQLIRTLRAHVDLSSEAEAALADALVARNEIVHRCLVGNWRSMMDPKLRSGLVLEIRALRGTVIAGTDSIAPTFILLNETEYGIRDEDVQRDLREALGYRESV